MANKAQFHVAGIPVRIEPAFLVIIAILGINPYDLRLSSVVSWMIVATASILLHEMGHAVMFRHYGARPSIVLHGFGGLTSASADLTPARHVAVSLAGPLSALLVLGLPSWWILGNGAVTGDAHVVLAQIAWINIGWSLLNLLPILPLDGGQVFASVLDIATRGRGRRTAEIVSVVVAGGVGLWALSRGFMFGALLAAMFAGMNITQLSRAKATELADRLVAAHRELLHNRAEEAEVIVADVLARRPSGAVLQWAGELAGWARLWQGDPAGAQGAVERYAHAGAPSASFKGALALAEGRTDEGVAVIAWAFANDPPGPAKSLGAVAASGAHQAEAVARELLAIDGGAGLEPTRLLQALLDHTGHRDEAASVGAMLRLHG